MPGAKITGNISARIRFLRKVMLEGYVCKRANFRHQQSVLEWILVGDEQEATKVFADYLTTDTVLLNARSRVLAHFPTCCFKYRKSGLATRFLLFLKF